MSPRLLFLFFNLAVWLLIIVNYLAATISSTLACEHLFNSHDDKTAILVAVLRQDYGLYLATE